MQVNPKANYTTERKGFVTTYYTLKITTGKKNFHVQALNASLWMDLKGCVKPYHTWTAQFTLPSFDT